MDHYSEMCIFVAVAEENGLAAAARRLNQSAPTITRAIAGLEKRLSTRLLDRNTRGVQLTEAGARYLNDCRRILHDVDEAEASASGLHAKPTGNLLISAPLLFGQEIITPIVMDFINEHPDVNVRATFIDRFPNLHEEGIDVAFLMGALPDSSLVAVKAGYIRRVVCASPKYLKLNGEPRHPDDIRQHELVNSLADARNNAWQFHVNNANYFVDVMPRLNTSTNTSAIIAAVEHFGLTRVMSYQVAEHIQAQRLRTVLNDFELPPMPVQVVYREGRKAAARVRSFVDFSVKRLRLAAL